MRVAAGLLLFLMGRSLYAQANCPTPDHNAPIPMALVSSPQRSENDSPHWPTRSKARIDDHDRYVS